jgi:hypothetical protein
LQFKGACTYQTSFWLNFDQRERRKNNNYNYGIQTKVRKLKELPEFGEPIN